MLMQGPGESPNSLDMNEIYENLSEIKEMYKIGVINDPPNQTHSPASCVIFSFENSEILKSGDRRLKGWLYGRTTHVNTVVTRVRNCRSASRIKKYISLPIHEH